MVYHGIHHLNLDTEIKVYYTSWEFENCNFQYFLIEMFQLLLEEN